MSRTESPSSMTKTLLRKRAWWGGVTSCCLYCGMLTADTAGEVWVNIQNHPTPSSSIRCLPAFGKFGLRFGFWAFVRKAHVDGLRKGMRKDCKECEAVEGRCSGGDSVFVELLG